MTRSSSPLPLAAAVLGAALLAAGAPAVAVALAPAPAPVASDDEAPAHPGDALHAPYDELLGNYVSDGWVDYTGLKQEAARELAAYLDALSRVDPAALDREATFAFWINAYNAFTLQLILEHLGDIDSIKDIPSSKRWKAKRWQVHGERYSLDQIEHDILRPMGDARIHFGLNCASKSCPDLLSEAYLPSTIDAQLDRAGRRFLTDPHKGAKVVTEEGWFGGKDHNLYLSKIFSWFDDDFERDAGSVVDFVLPYLTEEAADYVEKFRDDLDVEHLDYDWSLNGA